MTYFPARSATGSLRGPHHQTDDAESPILKKRQVEIMTLDEAAERIAFQVCHLAEQDHVSQAAERIVREVVLSSIHFRGSAKGAQQVNPFYATVLVAIAEQLNESEYLRDEWFIKWRDDCNSR